MAWQAIALAIIAAAQQLKGMREQSKARMAAPTTQPRKGRAGQIAALAGSAMSIYGAAKAPGPSPSTQGAHTDLTGKTTPYATSWPKGMKKKQQIDYLAEIKKYYGY